MAGNDSYYIFINGNFEKHTLREIAEYRRSHEKMIWSARPATGLFGRTDCPAGNKGGPKNIGEVILAAGDEGLVKLINLGFIPCHECKPEKTEGFWNTIEETVRTNYGITELSKFTDKKFLSYDSRRVAFEAIAKITGRMPDRLYLPRELSSRSICNLKAWLNQRGLKQPALGYYDDNAPGHFREY